MSMYRRRLMIANALKKSSGINYPGLIAAWSAKGKTNDDEDRAILKDLTGNGHDITLNGFAFSEMSGYGGYKNKLTSLRKNTQTEDRIFTVTSTKITVNAWDGESNIVYYFAADSDKKLSACRFKLSNITGVASVKFNYLSNGVIINDIITEDGIYELKDANYESDTFNLGISTSFKDKNVIIELLPEYPDALVFDGVDDYGINENMPILTDYTVIAKREILGNVAYACAICKYNGSKNGAFNFDMPNYNNLNSVFSYGYQNNVELPKNNISWMTPLNYNQQVIKKGTNIDGTNLSVGVLRSGIYYLQFVFYSAYLFDRSLDEQEIKEFIRKYIDPEYLLPSEQTPTPDCYYDFSLGSNDDENPEIIVDQSGNGNDAKAYNFAWEGMSGYGGYNVDFINTFSYIKTDRADGTITGTKINITQIKNTNTFIENSSAKIIPSFKIKITGITDNGVYIKYRYYLNVDGSSVAKFMELNTDGIYTLPQNNESKYNGFIGSTVGECNITIELIPEYPGALVLDGTDDYIVLEAFTSGFKIMFMVCNPFNLGNILYDQRDNTWKNYALQNVAGFTAYSFINENGTYINNVFNTKLTTNELINKKHLISIIANDISKSRKPNIGRSIGNNLFSNMAIYKFLGFKDELTEEQIQAVIKKYNLLDGVDEIEVS